MSDVEEDKLIQMVTTSWSLDQGTGYGGLLQHTSIDKWYFNQVRDLWCLIRLMEQDLGINVTDNIIQF